MSRHPPHHDPPHHDPPHHDPPHYDPPPPHHDPPHHDPPHPPPPHHDPPHHDPPHHDPPHHDPPRHVELYHATPRKHVDSIRARIRLDAALPRTDFARERHAFYLTDDLNKAKTVMAEEVAAFTREPAAIMAFSLNLEGLKVKTFSHEKEGATLNEWREFVKYNREPRKKGVVPPPHPITTEGYDVIIGWMSTIRGGQYEPIGTMVWQYAIVSQKGVDAMKLEKVE